MKNFVRILSFALVAVMLCATLASCGKVSGTYTGELDLGLGKGTASLKFGAFGKLEVTVTADSVFTEAKTVTHEGKYEITEKDDDKMEITITFEGDADLVTKALDGTKSFSIDKENDTITIGLFTFKKA